VVDEACNVSDVICLLYQEITFRIDYTVPSINREFGTVFHGDKNVALLVVSQGWAKVDFFVIYF